MVEYAGLESRTKIGRMGEWLNPGASKASMADEVIAGSNPAPSVKIFLVGKF